MPSARTRPLRTCSRIAGMVEKGAVYLAGEQIDHRRPAATIGNMIDLDRRHLAELLARKMDRGAEAGGGERHLAGFGLCERNQFLRGLCRHLGMYHQNEWRHRKQRHGCEIFLRVVRQLPAERPRIDDERAVDHADGVAVRRRGCDRLRADLGSRRRRDCLRRKTGRARARGAAGSAAPEYRMRRPAHTARSRGPGAADNPAQPQGVTARAERKA